ncbi:MAG: hypothetical protein E7022_04020 [Desulfovibrio desulfuricans]|nr:hypothetical protein [Desulfovibrio desulfuricans]
MNWLRWYTGSATDPKFAAVARRAGQNVAAVLAVWAMLLERACEADTRGDVDGFDCEGADVVLGLDDGAACAIVEAMKGKGLIEQGRLANWDKRQPKREDDSAERTREYRARKRAAEAEAQRTVTQCDAPVTQCDAAQRTVTHGNARGDKRREDKNINTYTPPVDNPVNEDPARSLERPTGGDGEKPSRPDGESSGIDPAVDLDGPGIEFMELRDAYNAVRPEGPLAGFPEYKQLKASRDRTGRSRYPGNARLIDDFTRRMEAGFWNPGYALGLAQYLKTRLWEQPVKARAAPARPPGGNDGGRPTRTHKERMAILQAAAEGKL